MGQFFAPLGQKEGVWDPLSLLEEMEHPRSQEKAHMNHLLRSNHPFTKGNERADCTLWSMQRRRPHSSSSQVQWNDKCTTTTHTHLTKTKFKNEKKCRTLLENSVLFSKLRRMRNSRERCVVYSPWRGPAGCPEFGRKRGARRSLSWEVITASLVMDKKQTKKNNNCSLEANRCHRKANYYFFD